MTKNAPTPKKYCEGCHRMKSMTEFYRSKNTNKYPAGYMNRCKDCMTELVDNWDCNTYLWILQEADVPYFPLEWNKILKTYAKDPAKVKGTTIIGRYLSKMQLNEYRDYRWKDTKFLQNMECNRITSALKAQGRDAQDIAQAINQFRDLYGPIADLSETDSSSLGEDAPPWEDAAAPDFAFEAPSVPVPSSYTNIAPIDKPKIEVADGVGYYDYDKANGFTDEDFEVHLTHEEKLRLRLKWGRTYKPEEWIQLEQMYNDFEQSYDIQTAGHMDTLKLICKTSLKAHELVDQGDLDGYQKMSRVYDQLMKSGKFTAAQNKEAQEGVLNSVSEIVTICEKEGFIPRYYIAKPEDKVDETLQDMKNYTRSLIMKESNLSNLIDNAVKEMQREENKAEDEDVDDAEVTSLEEADRIKDKDFEEMNQFLEKEREEDAKLFDLLEKDKEEAAQGEQD